MFVILVYDVKSTRDSKVMRKVKRYLMPVQESVYEGHITAKNLEKLKSALYQIIDPEHDYIKIYRFDSVRYAEQEELGKIRHEHSDIL